MKQELDSKKEAIKNLLKVVQQLKLESASGKELPEPNEDPAHEARELPMVEEAEKETNLELTPDSDGESELEEEKEESNESEEKSEEDILKERALKNKYRGGNYKGLMALALSPGNKKSAKGG